jgi:hypothetical protein
MGAGRFQRILNVRSMLGIWVVLPHHPLAVRYR